MKFVYGPVAMLIFVMFAFGVGMAAADHPGRENASCQLSNHSDTMSVTDNRQNEHDGKLNSPPTEKSDTTEDISDRIFSHPEFYAIPTGDYRGVLNRCQFNWRAARAEFTQNRSWTYGFDEARQRGYRLGHEREFEDARLLQMYLDRPLMPHPKYKPYSRPFDLQYYFPGH